MSDIEDIKEYKINLTQKQSIELLKNALNKFEIRGEQLYSLKIAIENILAEREQDKKRIKELEEQNETFKNFTSAIFNDNIEKEFIPKQKVKDKIEYYKKLQNNYIKKYDEVNDTLQGMINVLKEIVEDK